MGSACHLSFTLFFAFSFITCTNCIEYLKLPLVQKNNPLSLPAQLLSSDSHRLSTLFAALQGRRGSLKSPLVSGASTGSGQYFVDLRIGSPPQSLLLVADTGSDLVWVKCSACRNCSAHPPGSKFLVRHSRTFAPHHCYDSSCRLVPHPVQTQSQTRTCNHSKIHSPCLYSYSYVDGSTTSGLFSKETTTFNTSSGRVTKVKDFSFGCGFRVSGPSVTGNGGTVVDSGTTLTFLAEPAYRQVLAAFRRRVRLPPVEGANLGFDLCVNVTGAGKVKLPKLSFSFSGKSVMSPPARNYFIDAMEGVKCVAIQAVKEGAGFSVIGNLMQQGYLFEFDRDRSRLGFTRHGCTLG
ncbi:hypothetical protein Ahy_B05g076559 isoform A [Arachis hypogaea]|uniref:Peptidase A1 domain-containing protein n=1 Tax=Arachis hypogaea TaxID=3818 RepID=A0A444Z3I9_ARAHY|nr:hypothetical protein Ahy_B05g076559 isoform A [Arachis hypogaea]